MERAGYKYFKNFDNNEIQNNQAHIDAVNQDTSIKGGDYSERCKFFTRSNE